METALSKDPDNPTINYHMGAILVAMGKTSEAQQYLKKALESSDEFLGRPEAEKLLDKNREE